MNAEEIDRQIAVKFKNGDGSIGLKSGARSSLMEAKEIDRCQIQVWYPQFRSHSFQTLIHELPASFIYYLRDDSGYFVLPNSISGDDAFPNRLPHADSMEECLTEDDDQDLAAKAPSFPKLESDVNSSIAALGGAAFPKLNWSSPKDAAWISTTGNLRCSSFSEIVLLLRSSDSVVHDLCYPYDSCAVSERRAPPEKVYLALRRWHSSIRPEMEFRCFVRRQNLIGVSQREVTSFYPLLLDKKTDIQRKIQDFFEEHVRLRFESGNYVFDVYVTDRGRIKVVDFGPYGAFTLPLLFSWDELEDNYVSGKGEFRIVESPCGVRLGLKTTVPFDYIDTCPGSGWDVFLQRAEEELHQQRQTPEYAA